MNRSVILLIVSAAIAIFPVHAATELFSYVINPIGGYVDTVRSSNAPVSLTRSGSDSRGSGASRSSADFGILRSFSEAHAVNNGSSFQAMNAGSQASFRDDITINAPGLAGSSGTVTVKFKIDGSITCTGGGDSSRASYADFHYIFQKNGSTLQEDYYLLYFDGTIEGNNFIGQERTVIVPFTYGTPFEIKLLIETAARAYNFRGADAVSDFEHTATWGGFISVKDASDNTVTGYTAMAGSGADFTKPITGPVPQLFVRPVTGSQLQVTWNSQFSDYKLYFASETPATAWSLVESPAATNATEVSITIPTTETQRYFVLKKP